MVIIKDIPNKDKSYDHLRHEWITVHGIVICQCCGVQKRGCYSVCMSKWRITTKDGKLVANCRKKK